MVSPANTPAVITRLCFTAPLLFIAVLMVIDPEGFVRIIHSLEFTMRTFEQRIHGYPPQESEPGPVSATVRAVIRFTGVCLAVAAVFPLAILGS